MNFIIKTLFCLSLSALIRAQDYNSDGSLGERAGGMDFLDFNNNAYNPPAYPYDDNAGGLLVRESTSTMYICICAPYGTCQNDTYGPINLYVISGRISDVTSAGQQKPIITSTMPTNVYYCQAPYLELCCHQGPYQCGVQWPAVGGTQPPRPGQAYFAQYPWQAVLLDRNDMYLGSGALIDNYNVVTAAHKVMMYTAHYSNQERQKRALNQSYKFQTNSILTKEGGIKVRMGEWDSAGNYEPVSAQEFSVAQIHIHPQFNPNNLRNGIALVRLAIGVPLGQTPTINTICLPSSKIMTGTCFVSGWGKNDFRVGTYQAVQKSVDVPMVEYNRCASMLKATRLGPGFQLDPLSFICAGGVPGKDACTGDGGAPLVCEQNGKWYLAGLVAWGIGCGQSSTPGVYINIANYIPWIMQTSRQ